MNEEMKNETKGGNNMPAVAAVQAAARLTPVQQQAVDKIKALQSVTRATGMKTTRSINDVLNQLGTNDLAAVAAVVFQQ
jgi:hypothetical protein